jgi:hypothetical protein
MLLPPTVIPLLPLIQRYASCSAVHPKTLSMKLALLDWMIIGGFFAVSVAIGLYASRRSGKSFRSTFLLVGK